MKGPGTRDFSALTAVALLVVVVLFLLITQKSGIDEIPQFPLPAQGTSSNADFAQKAFALLPQQTILKERLDKTNRQNPFSTAHFAPPPPKPKPKPPPPKPKPKPKPQPPPPPKTKKIQLLYQGCVITSDGRKLGFVRVNEKLMVVTNGIPVAAGFAVSKITLDSLILTNRQGNTNVLQFRKPATITIVLPK